MKTFSCDFGSGVGCRVEVPEVPPPNGQVSGLVFAWTGRPTRKVIRPYVQWMNTVNEQLANDWGIKLMYVYQVSKTGLEAWVFEPGKPGERVAAHA